MTEGQDTQSRPVGAGETGDATIELIEDAVELQEANAPETSPAPSRKEIACNHCGHRQTNKKFCDNCGLRIDAPGNLSTDPEQRPASDEEDASPVKCRQCGVMNKASRSSCLQCATPLPQPE